MPARKPIRESAFDDGRIDPDAVRIGADIVELLTSGMYVAPITVFREYVQNAADAIDQARIEGILAADEPGQVQIEIDHAERTVTIRDNGTGVPAAALTDVLMAIGASAKRGTNARGFRGVGRLSGLAYCRTLEFRTKTAGEANETKLIWDTRALRSGISAARAGTDLRNVIVGAVSLETLPSEDVGAHFFEVVMRGVVRQRQDVLINEHAIAAYLGQVAPVPFADEFSHRNAIEERLAAFLPTRVPIELSVMGQKVTRPFRDTMAQPGTDKMFAIYEIEFFELADVDGSVGAIGWLGHHDYLRSISTSLGVRGLRARVGDVQVGEADLFDGLFKEPRFNGWTVGEVHVLDRRLIPNGRRDNFEVNHHSNNLLVQLGPIGLNISHRCRTSSVNRNASIIIRNTIAEVERVLELDAVDALKLSRAIAAVQRGFAKLRGVRDEALNAELRDELTRREVALASKQPAEGAGVISSDEALALVNRIVTNREQAKRLIAELLKLKA
jgi:molecular chaperone HtpG